MSAVVSNTPLDSAAAAPEKAWVRWLQRIEERLAALTESANPILVKETRQALKSRQFVVTFLIVLIACWIVSFGGVALIGPQIYYSASGPQLLLWYYVILVVPLLLIVPYSAFRSLAAEQEDNTYDLLSITTLTSKQIVTGKLSSAIVQMLVYVCAVSPCIAFTFLLRGVDALLVGFLLWMAVLTSLGLSMAALVVGAIARVRNTQVVISVALVLGLAGVCVGSIDLAYELIREGSGFLRETEFWTAAFGGLTIYLTSFGLMHAAAAAQIAFVSENRSTRLRWWMMAQQACFVGWTAALAYAAPNNFVMIGPVMAVGAGVMVLYWYLMGALLTGEWPHLSRRVQRSLPQSRLGRTFLSFFNPGPASGYMFAVANLTTLTLVEFAAVSAVNFISPGPIGWTRTVLYFLVLSWSYTVAFLGAGLLIINLLRKWVFVPMAAAFLVHTILMLAGVGGPTLLQMTSRQLQYDGYSLVQVTNPFWTLGELVANGSNAVQAQLLVLIVPAVALAALVLNMRAVAGELMHHRVAPPVRVAEDEAELAAPPPAGPANPWEAEEDEA